MHLSLKKNTEMRNKHYLVVVFLLLFTVSVNAQNQKNTNKQAAKPKLIVGLVIDQMRWDYLYRFKDLYVEGGFKRLLNQGFSCENTFLPYVPTYTAVGHTCIYTGSIPSIDGIIGNNWYEKSINKSVYCTDDSTVSGVGTTSDAGKMSPKNLWVTTITDELRLSNNFKSKVIGIALKDRASILPAGHSANAAYWYDKGKWITSTHYMTSLPAWVNNFNAKDEVSSYMAKDWNTLLPIDKYSLSTADDKIYEGSIPGEKTNTFPHRTSLITKGKYETIKFTPSGATFTFDFAKQAIDNEQLGKNTVPDFLTVSISSTDYIGHTFGTNSIEIEDTYLRLDRDIADFLNYLDAKIGKGNYLLFLTADHGVAHTPGFLKEHNIPGGTFSDKAISKELNNKIQENFGISNAVLAVMNYEVYLDENGIKKQGNNLEAIKQFVINILLQKEYVTNAFETKKIAEETLPTPIKERLINGFNDTRSGDIQFVPKAGYFDGGSKGTTHGLWNPYDSHIPLVWFGWGVNTGKTNKETYMTDISATLAGMLQIQMPSGCVGHVITEVIK
jgi:predicted AlkP superfamily pyrophosphatase or phosphodiesterase